MALDAPSVAFGEFVFGERGEEACRGPSLPVGAFGEGLPEPLDGGQAELGEHERELDGVDLVGVGRGAVVGVGHAAPPGASKAP